MKKNKKMEKIEIENYRGSLMRERYDDEDIPSRWRHCIRKFFDDQMIKLGQNVHKRMFPLR